MTLNLLKNPNTNWKYIAIVVILAAIVGGGAFWLIKEKEIKLPEMKTLKKEVTFYSECSDIADIWTNMPQDKKIEECNKILSQQIADLQNIGFEPKDCKAVRAEAEPCLSGLGTNLACTYSCKKKAAEVKPSTRVEDETANWKTYRNERYRFEIKYPNSLEYDEYFSPEGFELRLSDKGSGERLYKLFVKEVEGYTVEDWHKEVVNSLKQLEPEPPFLVEDIQLLGRPAKKVHLNPIKMTPQLRREIASSYFSGVSGDQWMVAVANDEYFYTFFHLGRLGYEAIQELEEMQKQLFSKNLENSENAVKLISDKFLEYKAEYKNLFDKIISTFKFLD